MLYLWCIFRTRFVHFYRKCLLITQCLTSESILSKGLSSSVCLLISLCLSIYLPSCLFSFWYCVLTISLVCLFISFYVSVKLWYVPTNILYQGWPRIVVNGFYYAFYCLLAFLGINHNAGTLPELNVYRTENSCITNSNGSYKSWLQGLKTLIWGEKRYISHVRISVQILKTTKVVIVWQRGYMERWKCWLNWIWRFGPGHRIFIDSARRCCRQLRISG